MHPLPSLRDGICVSRAPRRQARGGGRLTLETDGRRETEARVRIGRARGAQGHLADDFFSVLERKLSDTGFGENTVPS